MRSDDSRSFSVGFQEVSAASGVASKDSQGRKIARRRSDCTETFGDAQLADGGMLGCARLLPRRCGLYNQSQLCVAFPDFHDCDEQMKTLCCDGIDGWVEVEVDGAVIGALVRSIAACEQTTRTYA